MVCQCLLLGYLQRDVTSHILNEWFGQLGVGVHRQQLVSAMAYVHFATVIALCSYGIKFRDLLLQDVKI